MDREITKDEQRRRALRRIAVVAAVAAVVVGGAVAAGRLIAPSVDGATLRMADVDRGDIDVTIAGTGRVEPAFEEVINSPLSSRVVEVYHRSGDVVEAGTPLLRLDLDAARTDYDSRLDELAMLRLQLSQLRANNRTRLSDLRKQIEVACMRLQRLDAELVNERYLDSIGSGTTDRVREVRFNRDAGRLELEQLEQQLANETDVMAADERLKQLEIDIKNKDVAQQARTLGDAEIRAPRRATVTSIADRLGATVSAGQQIATVADLGHYRVDARFADSYASDLKAGGRVRLTVSRKSLDGFVSSVSPTARDGMLDVVVTLDCDSADVLRPGVKADVAVSNGLRVDVVRIPNAGFYTGPGDYRLYVRRDGSDELEVRQVKLGAAGYDYVEVLSGLVPGDRIVTSGTDRFGKETRIKIK
ncbi:MAG: HlyD family efflux transporter periplasmic adaptor subunit [Bacteroidales bacterium]|nr:HlyD family efflux transporter periplasmic adaptor subunit [Bacteroidales bacterium]